MRNPPPTPRQVRAAQQSKSATVRAAAAAPSRRQRSHWQREQQQQRTLFIAVGVLAVLVLAIFGAGLVWDNIIRANQVVAQIGDESVTAAQLVDEVRPQARAIDAQAKQVGSGANIANYVDQQKRSLPDTVLNSVIDVRIIQQEATRRGISLGPTELDDKERQTIADYQNANNPAPTPEPSPTAEPGATDSSAAGLTSATPEVTQAPTAAAFSTPTTPTAVPTLEESAYGAALQQLLDKNSLTEADLRKQLGQSLLRDKVQTAVGQDQVPETQEEVHARQILVTGVDQANDLLTQLQGGADFAQLAAQYSTDAATKSNGGDMGWFARGAQAKALEDAAFALQPGQLSDVVQDATGYHIIQVLERDPARAIPPDQLTTQRQKAFTDWLSAQRSGANIKLSLDQSEKDWVLGRIGVRP
jgi:parvulin-like peptidyl-prolyl isomerase